MHKVIWRENSGQTGSRSAIHCWTGGPSSGKKNRGVWIIHGIGEHAFRYNELALYLVERDYDVFAPDLPGHGLSASEGSQTKLLSVPEMVDCLQKDLDFCCLQEKHDRWFLMGHSLGGLLGLFWLESKIKNVFLRALISAPPLKLRMPVPVWKRLASSILFKVAPDLRISTGLSVQGLSYDIANIAAYRNDPLNHGQASPRLYESMTAEAARLRVTPECVRVPLCLTVGADDPIADPTAIRDYCEKLQVEKHFVEFEHMKHETFNEVGRVRVYETLLKWFNSQR